MVPLHKIKTFPEAWDFFGPLNGTSECHVSCSLISQDTDWIYNSANDIGRLREEEF